MIDPLYSPEEIKEMQADVENVLLGLPAMIKSDIFLEMAGYYASLEQDSKAMECVNCSLALRSNSNNTHLKSLLHYCRGEYAQSTLFAIRALLHKPHRSIYWENLIDTIYVGIISWWKNV